ncbi:MAG: ABC-F family ATP-binding cassette domain-containing protein [Humidesulfovibrio sp.]|nr:ABC-F family ATP-binding cassette domain-containing protein [Humidesulfovibrio sp.]
MSKITVQNIEKSYGGEALFSGLSFEALPGMRLAVAGPNGAGKSTLLRILASRAEPESGSVVMSKGARVGYVAQELSGADLSEPLLGWVLSALPSWRDFWREWEEAVDARDEAKLHKLSDRQARFEAQYGYHPEHKARAILSGLGFRDEDLSRRLEHLSGGWRERAKLARVLLQGADILLLDEPTNHLDLEAVQWLEDYLLAFKGTLIFVAHDRVFLERVGSHVLVLGGAKPILRSGSFSDFLAWMAENAEQREREAAKITARIDHEQDFIRRFRVKARKAAQAQSKLKKVEKLQDELSRLKGDQLAARSGHRLSFRLPEPPRGDKVAVNVVDLEFSYAERQSAQLWPRLNFQIFRGRKIALVAPNGAGKSTLLKVLTGALAPTHGYAKLGNSTQLAYFSQHQTEILRPTGTVIAEMRRLCDPKCTEEQLMGVLGLFLLGESYFERPVAALSGGEKSRLVMASLFLGRANLLILDEPTNHLDLESREGLVAALKDYEGTLFMVAHDRYLMGEVAEEIWTLGPDGLVQHHEGFEDYDAKRRVALIEAKQGAKREAKKPECAPVAQDAEVEDGQGSKRLSKDEKRKLAEQRNALSRALKPLREEYAKCEKDLERVLLEQGELEAKMNDPATYESAGEALTVNNQYREVSDWAEKLMERMAVLEEKMTAVQADMGFCLDG